MFVGYLLPELDAVVVLFSILASRQLRGVREELCGQSVIVPYYGEGDEHA